MTRDEVRADRSFGDDAAQYDRARPSYPAALLDDLVTAGVDRVLDVGCGTGIVSRLLAERGCHVLGVEHDERMAAVARDRGTEVEVARFEDWDDRGRTFDLVTSGQAWHWIEPVAGFAQVARVLRSGGRFAAFWNTVVLPPDLRVVVDDVYGRRAPHLLVESVALGTSGRFHGEDEGALVADGSFVDVDRRSYGWTRPYEVDEWLDELPTHSGHRLLPTGDREALIAELRDRLQVGPRRLDIGYETRALLATRR